MEEQYQVTCPRGHITHIQRKTALTLFGELGVVEIDSGIRLSAEVRCIDCAYCQDDADRIERDNERLLGPFDDFFAPPFTPHEELDWELMMGDGPLGIRP